MKELLEKGMIQIRYAVMANDFCSSIEDEENDYRIGLSDIFFHV